MLVRTIKNIFKMIFLLYIVLLIGLIVFGLINRRLERRIMPSSILEFDFERSFSEQSPDAGISSLFLGTPITVLEVSEALKRASDDDRVWGIVARIGESTNLGMAQIQEIRDAIIDFRGSGKRAIAWSESFGEFGPGNRSYYLATAFDEIYLLPTGNLGLTGLSFGAGFVKETLNKLNIKPQLDHRYEYKNLMNIFTERRFTKPHKEATQSIMQSEFNQLVSGIAESRGISPEEVRELIDGAPYMAQEALANGLVDGLLYRDEVYSYAKKQAGPDANLLYLDKYLSYAGSPWNKGEAIALIRGVGPITRGNSGFDPMFSSYTMGSDTIAAAFRDAVKDKEVRAIIFRVDSPGGSAIASDIIWREIERAKSKGKPVIITMGNVAASGGYWVSTNATKIVAQPATITGSIGVLGGKFYTREFWERLGITWDEVHTSRNATMWSTFSQYSDAEREKLELWLDRVYQDFITRVSRGRGIPEERVGEIARGRIWTGEQAKGLGLVDELGGYREAIRLAKEAAGIAPERSIKLKYFPKRKTMLERLLQYWFGKDKERSSNQTEVRFHVLDAALKAGEPLFRATYLVGKYPGEYVLLMPYYLFGLGN